VSPLNSAVFKPRHKEKMIEDRKEIDEILTKAQVGRLAASMGNRPYVVPMNFVYHQGRIYFHSAPEGQMFSYLKANNQVCFEVDESEIVPNVEPCEFTFRYRSVLAFGKVRFIEDLHEKHTILTVMLEKYDQGKLAAHPIPEEKVRDIAVGEITIETLTGKKNL
jgi:nitroimidazol reductase NimA-like FMN-containing flavoprotein (pyridoxamine 5'-phosphate oxidase superfamily)